MINREDIVSQALSMIGTKWHHQGRAPGHGLDCIGLIICVMRNLGMRIDDVPDYGMQPAPAKFLEQVVRYVPQKSIRDMQRGDMLLIAPGKILQHACIYLGGEMIIHVEEKGFVCERRLSDWECRIRYCFDLSNPYEYR